MLCLRNKSDFHMWSLNHTNGTNAEKKWPFYRTPRSGSVIRIRSDKLFDRDHPRTIRIR
jgi:hypothetical protein